MSVERIAVIGSGIMGHGIAQVAAISGQDVSLIDTQAEALEKAMRKIKNSLGKLAEKGKIQEDPEVVLERIQTTSDLVAGVSQADCVIEAVFEDIDLKSRLMREADVHSPPHAVLATNTSGLSITLIAEGTKRREKVIGMHWMNPPQIMRLIEVIRSKYTDDDTMQDVLDLCEGYGKVPVLARKDVWFFLAARARAGWSIENNLVYLRKEATVEEIDAVARHRLGLPMGEFEIFDFTGAVDIRTKGLESLKKILEQYPEFEPWPPLLSAYRHLAEFLWKPMRDKGLSGVKTGKGFYAYPGGTYTKPDISETLSGKLDPLELLAPAVNVAAWCVSQGVGSVEDVDKSFRLAFGWPKGLFEFLEDYKVAEILRILGERAKKAPDWLAGFYEPAPVLADWKD